MNIIKSDSQESETCFLHVQTMKKKNLGMIEISITQTLLETRDKITRTLISEDNVNFSKNFSFFKRFSPISAKQELQFTVKQIASKLSSSEYLIVIGTKKVTLECVNTINSNEKIISKLKVKAFIEENQEDFKRLSNNKFKTKLTTVDNSYTVDHTDSNQFEFILDFFQRFSVPSKRDEFQWLDIETEDANFVQLVGKMLDLHPLTVEDIVSGDTREKLEFFERYVFFVMRDPYADNIEVYSSRPLKNPGSTAIAPKIKLEASKLPGHKKHLRAIPNKQSTAVSRILTYKDNPLESSRLSGFRRSKSIRSFPEAKAEPKRESVEIESYPKENSYSKCTHTSDRDSDTPQKIDSEDRLMFFVWSSKLVVSFRGFNSKVFQNLMSSIVRRKKSAGFTLKSGSVIHGVLDNAVDIMIEQNELVGEEMERIEENIQENKDLWTGTNNEDLEVFERLSDLKKFSLELKKGVWPKKSILNSIISANVMNCLKEVPKPYFLDILDHLEYITTELGENNAGIENLQNYCMSKISIEMTKTSNHSADIMEVLTILTTITTPVEIFGALFGINLKIPFGQSTSLKPFWVALSLVVVVTILFWLWLKWLGVKIRRQR